MTKRTRRGRWVRRTGRQADARGFTLVEVAIAAVILLIVMTPVVSTMYGALSSASSDQALAGVSQVAAQQLEKLHAVPYTQVGFYGNATGYVPTWQGQSTVELGATGTSAITPVTTTTVSGVDVTVETFITWVNATVPATSGTSTTVDVNAYKLATVLVCWVPGSPHQSLSSCTSSQSSVVPVATGQATVRQSTLIYPGGQGPYGGTTTSSSTTTTVAPVAPGAPTNVQVSPDPFAGNSEIDVTWSAPTTGGTPTSYTVEWSSTPAFTNPIQSNPITAPASSYTVTGLSPSTTYYFEVFANNGAGSGAASAQAPATTNSSATTTTTAATTTTTSGGTTTTTSGGTTTTTVATTTTTTTTTVPTTTTTIAPCTPVSFSITPGGSSWTNKVYLDHGNQKMPGDIALSLNLEGSCNDTITVVGDGPNSTTVAAPLSPYSLSHTSGYAWSGNVASNGSNNWGNGTYVFTVYENGSATTPSVAQDLLVCAYTSNPSSSPTTC